MKDASSRLVDAGEVGSFDLGLWPMMLPIASPSQFGKNSVPRTADFLLLPSGRATITHMGRLQLPKSGQWRLWGAIAATAVVITFNLVLAMA